MCAQAHSEFSLQIWYVSQTYEAKTEGVFSPLLQCSPRMALSFFKKHCYPLFWKEVRVPAEPGNRGKEAGRDWQWGQQLQRW